MGGKSSLPGLNVRITLLVGGHSSCHWGVAVGYPYAWSKTWCVINGRIIYNAMQYNTIQNNTIQYNTIQYNTIHNTIQYNTTQYNTIQYNTIQYKVHSRINFLVIFCMWCLGCGLGIRLTSYDSGWSPSSDMRKVQCTADADIKSRHTSEAWCRLRNHTRISDWWFVMIRGLTTEAVSVETVDGFVQNIMT